MPADLPHARIDAIRLRPTAPGDVPAMYEFQTDPESNRMAGTKPRTRDAFFAAWERIFRDPKINSRIIEVDGELAGSVNVFQAPREGRSSPAADGEDMRDCVGYWIARSCWGRGVGSLALSMFLEHEESRRPLHATAARANIASLRILEKCGFRCTGYRMGEESDRYIACEIAEFVLE